MTRALHILAVAVLLAAPAARADEVEDAATAAAETAASLALNPLAALDKGTLDGFRDLPLFTPSRTRPAPPPEPEPVVAAAPPPAPEPEPEPPAEPPTLTLSGIAEGPEGAVAFIAKEGEEVEQVRLGDDVDGWLVTAIEAASLKLTLDEREQEYRLFVRPEPGEGSSGAEESDGAKLGDEDPIEDEQVQQQRQQKAQRQPAPRPAPPPGARRPPPAGENMTIRRQQRLRQQE